MKLPINRDNIKIPKISMPRINLSPFIDFLHSRFFKIYFIVLVIITIFICTGIVSYSVIQSRKSAHLFEKIQNFEEFSKRDIDIIRLNDLEVPNFFKGKNENTPIFYRKKLEKWSSEMVEDFKENPRQISIEILEQENDNKIDELFKNVK